MNKLDQIQASIDEVAAVQTEQHFTLIEHTRRSAANEARLDVMEQIGVEFTNHLQALRGALTAFKYMAAALTLTGVLIQIYQYYKG